jgi:hypothetical protein
LAATGNGGFVSLSEHSNPLFSNPKLSLKNRSQEKIKKKGSWDPHANGRSSSRCIFKDHLIPFRSGNLHPIEIKMF